MLRLKSVLILVLLVLFISNVANAQSKIAVMDFRAGTGVENVDGMSAVFSTYFTPLGYTLVERTQIDRIIVEQGFQRSALTQEQMVRIGQLLNIQKMVVGDIIIIGGQYEIDVRVVNVETSEVGFRDGETWAKGMTYRDAMRNLAERIVSKMNADISAASAVAANAATNSNTIVTLYNYLKVFPEDLGDFPSPPTNVIKAINSNVPYGYNDWRVPTIEEMALIKANRTNIAGIGNGEYMTSDGKTSGILRLVTTGKTFAESEDLRIQQETEQRRLAEERRAREAEERRQAEEKHQREEQIMASLSTFEAARFYMLRRYGQDINYIRSSSEITGRLGWSYVDHRQLSNIPAMQKLLTTHRFWWGHQGVNNYDNQPIRLINDKRGRVVPGWTNISVYDSRSRNYTTQRMIFGTRHQIEGQLPSDVVFMNECLYADLYYRQLNSEEASRLADQIVITASEELRKTEEAKVLAEQTRVKEEARQIVEQQRIEQEKQLLAEQIKLEKEKQQLAETQRLAEVRKGEEYKLRKEITVNGTTWATTNIEAQRSLGGLGIHYDYETAKTVCPYGWRLPTEQDFRNLASAGFIWTTINGVNGYLFGKRDNNIIFLPDTGTGRDYGVTPGSHGGYWIAGGKVFHRPNGKEIVFYNDKKYAFVRCVRE